jgi:hypothetical protein
MALLSLRTGLRETEIFKRNAVIHRPPAHYGVFRPYALTTPCFQSEFGNAEFFLYFFGGKQPFFGRYKSQRRSQYGVQGSTTTRLNSFGVVKMIVFLSISIKSLVKYG